MKRSTSKTSAYFNFSHNYSFLTVMSSFYYSYCYYYIFLSLLFYEGGELRMRDKTGEEVLSDTFIILSPRPQRVSSSVCSICSAQEDAGEQAKHHQSRNFLEVMKMASQVAAMKTRQSLLTAFTREFFFFFLIFRSRKREWDKAVSKVFIIFFLNQRNTN